MADWDARYVAGDTPWELGQPSPPLVDLLQEYRERLGRVVVPGCGRGVDAIYAASLGADVTGWDLAPSAIAAARESARTRGLPATFAVHDALNPAPEDTAAFDTLVEHTFFCAIPVDLRPRYVDAAATLLRPDGRILGVFMIGDRTQGPPFGTSEDELRTLFSPRFQILRLAPATNSPGHWPGREMVGILELVASS